MEDLSWLSMNDFDRSIALSVARDLSVKFGSGNVYDDIDLVSFQVVRATGESQVLVAVRDGTLNVMVDRQDNFSQFDLADPKCFEDAAKFVEKWLGS